MKASRSTLYGAAAFLGVVLWFVGVPLGTLLTIALVGFFLTMHMGGHGGCGGHGGTAHSDHSQREQSVDQRGTQVSDRQHHHSQS